MAMSTFDAVAADFDRFRAMPHGVPAAIRKAIWDALGGAPEMRILDLGAGTGRIGEAFLTAGDHYVAVDPSAQMLARFAARAAAKGQLTPPLVLADGQSLPFPSAAFDAVLMVHVISGSSRWRSILEEARRVLRPGKGLVLGRTLRPPAGLDARMREHLSRILADLGVDARQPGANRDDARVWLAPSARRITDRVIAHWQATQSPRDFLTRHEAGARFRALPLLIKDEALRRLADWAAATFGTLDTPLAEMHAFVIDVYFL